MNFSLKKLFKIFFFSFQLNIKYQIFLEHQDENNFQANIKNQSVTLDLNSMDLSDLKLDHIFK
jgi:hypothetical protein